MSIQLANLPYGPKDLEPHMSEQTLSFHHGKHHQTYVDKTNAAIEGTDLADASLDQIIAKAHETGNAGLFNASAQVFNHDFFWHCMSPDATEPSAELSAALTNTFGSVDGFKETFAAKAAAVFGSGWLWLVKDGSELKIIETKDAGTPSTMGVTPLLTIDVWEHAYYLDYQNARPGFIKAFLGTLINWNFVSENFSNAS